MFQSIIKDRYRQWIKAAVNHDPKSFVEICAIDFNVTEAELWERLKQYEWFKTEFKTTV